MTCDTVIFCDGGSRGNPGQSASAFVVVDDNGVVIHKQATFLGVGTNNNAEYRAVLLALGWLQKSQLEGINTVCFNLDSQLVVYQIIGKYQVKDSNLKSLLTEIKSILAQLPIQATFNYIPRAQNSKADQLVNETLDAHTV